MGHSGTCSCPVYLVYSLLACIHSALSSLPLQQFVYTYSVQIRFWCPHCRSWWYRSVRLCLPGMQLDVIHVQKVSDGPSTSESISISTFSDELASGLRPVQNSRDSASPWCILHFIVTSVIALELVSHSPSNFLMNVIGILLAFYSAKHSRIHLWDSES